MKKILKNNLIGFILGGLIFGSIGVYAATLYNANQISYEGANGSTNVKEALDYLYENLPTNTIFENANVLNVESSPNGKYSATLSRTFDKDCMALVSFHNGNSSYNLTISINNNVLNNVNFWNFGLYPNPTKMINVKKDDTLIITISGPAAGEFDYYKVFIGEFILD